MTREATIPPSTRTRIESAINTSRVVLFMKGTREQPQCGFSAATVGILDNLVEEYETINVLADPEIREGIKAYSDWPTVPQLYIDREFVGGCDIVREMYNAGELHECLGLEAPDRAPPRITLTDDAAEIIRSAIAEQPDMAVHLTIDAAWNHNFSLGPRSGSEIVAHDNGIDVLVDLGTAPRANGLVLSASDSFQGRSLGVDNPNMPPPVKQMSPAELAERRNAGETVNLFDVRPPDERAKASIAGAETLDEGALDRIAALPKDAVIVFFCHHGQRSQSAAERFRLRGHTNVHNLAGGIDAWSREVDRSVPRY